MGFKRFRMVQMSKSIRDTEVQFRWVVQKLIWVWHGAESSDRTIFSFSLHSTTPRKERMVLYTSPSSTGPTSGYARPHRYPRAF